MLRFTAARIAQSIVTLLVLSMVVFFGSELTGDLALSLATADTTEAELEEIRRKLGLDRPAYERYARYLGNLGRRATWACPAPAGGRSAR